MLAINAGGQLFQSLPLSACVEVAGRVRARRGKGEEMNVMFKKNSAQQTVMVRTVQNIDVKEQQVGPGDSSKWCFSF